MSLTPRQRDVLLFVQRAIDATGVCPSYTEIIDAVGLKSKGRLSRIIADLRFRGFVACKPGCYRAITVLRRLPDPDAQEADPAKCAYRAALQRISVGEGVYGAQAHEYKQIARKTLEEWP